MGTSVISSRLCGSLSCAGSVKPEGFEASESGQAALVLTGEFGRKDGFKRPFHPRCGLRQQPADFRHLPLDMRLGLPVGNAIPLGQFIVLDVVGFQCGPDRHFGGGYLVKFPGGHTCGRQNARMIGISLWSTVSMVCFRTAAGTSATR